MRIVLQVGGALDGIFAVIELLPFHLRLNLEFDGCFREECGSAEECGKNQFVFHCVCSFLFI